MALKILAPWMSLYHEIQAFFALDEDVHVIYDENTIKLYVDGDECKAVALDMLLKHEYDYGGMITNVEVIPCNCNSESLKDVVKYFGDTISGDVIHNALIGNAAFEYVHTINGVLSNPITYVVFANQVVQYFVDNLFDVHGQRSTLYEVIAKEIFEDFDGIFYCTEKPANEAPTAFWP